MKYELNDVDFVLVLDSLGLMRNSTLVLDREKRCQAVIDLLRSQRGAQSHTEADPDENTYLIHHNLGGMINIEAYLDHKRVSGSFVYVNQDTIQFIPHYPGTYKINCFLRGRVYSTTITVPDEEDETDDNERLASVERILDLHQDTFVAIIQRLEKLEEAK